MPLVPLRDGKRLHVRVVGRGKPVLLLHGLGLSSRQWLPAILPYTRQFKFYMPDFRCAGRSAHVSFNKLDIFQNNMEDVQDIVRYFGLSEFLLGGYSLGGSTALHWLREEGFKGVRRYLHIEQAPCICNRENWSYGLFGDRQKEIFSELYKLDGLLTQYEDSKKLSDLSLVDRKKVMHILASAFSKVVGSEKVRPFFLLSAYFPFLLTLAFPNPYLRNLKALLFSYLNAHDYRPSLYTCKVPVTTMVGMRSSPYNSQGQLKSAELVPNCHVVRFEKSDHVLMVSEPIRFFRELGRFLNCA